jgi:hypothetical protein
MAILVLNKLFFIDADPATGTVLALATFGVACVARPVGRAPVGPPALLAFVHLYQGLSRRASRVVPAR